MTIVQISPEAERNMYDDSDFYISVLDTETGAVGTHAVGSTRYGSRIDCGHSICYCGVKTPAELDDAERAAFEGALWGYALRCAEYSEINRIERPGPLMGEWIPPAGIRVALKESVKNRRKVETQCTKCAGTGHWVNPRNERDKRPCFGCSGTGKRLGHAKGAGMRTIPAGTVGTVVSASERRSQYGTWSYGATAVVRDDEGNTFNAPTDKLRLDEQPDYRSARRAAIETFKRATTWVCGTARRSARNLLQNTLSA